jgi:hypothetical protein
MEEREHLENKEFLYTTKFFEAFRKFAGNLAGIFESFENFGKIFNPVENIFRSNGRRGLK